MRSLKSLPAHHRAQNQRGRGAFTGACCDGTTPMLHSTQPPIPVYPHVYPPESPNPEIQHPCGFPADLPEQVQNLE